MKVDAITRRISIDLEDESEIQDFLDVLDVCSACLRQGGLVELDFAARTRLERFSSRLATSLSEFSLTERLGGETIH